MTVIQEPVGDIIGENVDSVYFQVPQIRGSNDGTRTVVPISHEFFVDDGVLTTDDLDPGPAQVRIMGRSYDIVIPYSVSPVRLWPLIDTHLDPPSPTATGYVKDGGGVQRVEAVTADEYAGMVLDPETLYVFKDGS